MSALFKVTPAQSIIGKVVGIEPFAGQYGPSYNIDLETGDGVFRVTEKQDKIHEQFTKIGLSRTTAMGRTIKMWKKAMADNPMRGYLNIELMDTGRSTYAVTNPANGPLAAPVGRVVGTINQSNTPYVPPKSDTGLPPWLDNDSKEGQIKERARSDFEWAWGTAWGIMSAKVEDSGSAMGDPLVIQAVQSAAIGLVIRLEHERKQ